MRKKKKYIQLRAGGEISKPEGNIARLGLFRVEKLGCVLMGHTEELIFEVWHGIASSAPDCRSWLEMEELEEGCKDVSDRNN